MSEPARVICADPPWLFGDKLPGPGRGASSHYGCMSIAELCAFPLPLLADKAHLFLWRVASMQEEALRLVRAWGFVPKAEIVWLKRTRTGKRHFGMGRQVRMEHEVSIIATRGSAMARVRNIRSTFEAMTPLDDSGKARHSAKPEEFYDIVESLCAGPYVELFARRVRPGWECFGNQTDQRQFQAAAFAAAEVSL